MKETNMIYKNLINSLHNIPTFLPALQPHTVHIPWPQLRYNNLPYDITSNKGLLTSSPRSLPQSHYHSLTENIILVFFRTVLINTTSISNIRSLSPLSFLQPHYHSWQDMIQGVSGSLSKCLSLLLRLENNLLA